MRKKIKFDDNWKFHYGDIVSDRNRWGFAKSGSWMQGPECKEYDDSEWECIELPHDFTIGTTPTAVMKRDFDGENAIPEMQSVNNMHTTAGSFQKNVGWYRKKFFIPKEDEGREIYLVFDGIYRDSRAYLNDFFIGGEESGYRQLVYRITDFVNYGGDNFLSVRCDARKFEGWFYEGAGIYRHAYLLKTAWEHIDNVFVHCDVDLEKNAAVVHIDTELENCGESANVTLSTEIYAPDGTRVGTVSGKAGEAATITVADTLLWDTEQPYLYTAVTSLLVNGEKKDEYRVRFGIRDIRFDGEKGFLLNGRQVKIKGVCCHQNHGGLGSALPDEIYRFRIRKLKEMGANGYRCSHYPPTPELLDICDEEGMLVMDENRILSSEGHDLELLRHMVKRDRNHPSVILYSIGNEEAQSQAIPQGALIARRMIQEIKKLDAYTPVTMALLMWDLKNRVPIEDTSVLAGISEQLDVAGFNYHESRWPGFHEKYPNQPMICTEQGTFKSTRGTAVTDAANCHLAITDKTADSYMKGANQWRACRPDWVSGLFIWTGFDYYGEPTPYAWPAVSSQFGAMDLCGNPKDFYYYYKAWWTEEPVLHVFPHWNLEEGAVTDVHVFSNCREVELFLNDRSLGKKQMEQDGYLVWENVAYEPGMLEAIGVGCVGGEKVIIRNVLETTGTPAKICAEVEYTENDIRVVKVMIQDKEGRTVPTADNLIRISIENGEVLGTSNGNPSEHDAVGKTKRAAFNGLAQIIVRVGEDAVLRLNADGLEGAEVRL